MHYLVSLWAHPYPRTLQEARAMHEKLPAQQAPSPKVAQQLAALLKEAINEEAGLTGLQIDFSPPNAPFLKLSFPASDAAHCLPLIVRESLALGLMVYDPQADLCHRPVLGKLDAKGQTALPLESLQPRPLRAFGPPQRPARALNALETTAAVLEWRAQREQSADFRRAFEGAASDTEPITAEWVQGRLLARHLPWLQREGFTEVSSSAKTQFMRLTPAGVQQLTAEFQSYFIDVGKLEYELELCYTIKLWLPAPLQALLSRPAWLGFGGIRHAAIQADRKYRENSTRAVVESRQHLDLVLDQIGKGWADEVLPLLNLCRTYAGILGAAREGLPWTAWLLPTDGLLALAHWEGAADFLDLSLKMQQRASKEGASYAHWVWNACTLRAAPELFGTLHGGHR